jgi:nitric oxide reductase NorQ protein
MSKGTILFFLTENRCDDKLVRGRHRADTLSQWKRRLARTGTIQPMKVQEIKIEEFCIREEPYYLPIRDEVEIYRAAFRSKIPVLLKGPTGTGKTRFIEYMTYTISRELGLIGNDEQPLPLITVACHEDLTTTDLVGKYLLKGDETVWVDGPLTRAVKAGGICYLDEIVEARKDTTVIIHPLADHRRVLPIDKKGEIVEAHENFHLVISYNPGYQSVIKDLKQSTRQRFIAIDFNYPPRHQEAQIIQHESTINEDISIELATLGEKIRNLKGHALTEGASTRLLIYAGRLIREGVEPRRACDIAIAASLTDDHEIQRTISELISTIFP